MGKKKFSKDILLIKLSSRKFWVWIGSMFLTSIVLIKNGDHNYLLALIIIHGIISTIYIVGEPLEKGIGIMFQNAKITAELKAGAQANINTDSAKVMEAAAKNGG